MTEFSRLAGKYHLQGEVIQTPGGLGKVKDLMGENRLKKLLKRGKSRTPICHKRTSRIITRAGALM